MRQKKDWDAIYIKAAREYAELSLDPAKKVGCVIVRPNHKEASRGYNGFPMGVDDCENRYLDKDFKKAVVMHAEENAIANANEDLTGYTLYVSPYQPCAHCASWIISKGISRVVTDMVEVPEKWRKNFEYAKTIFEEAGVTLDVINTSSVDTAHNIDTAHSIDNPKRDRFFLFKRTDQNFESVLVCQLVRDALKDGVINFKVLDVLGDDAAQNRVTVGEFACMQQDIRSADMMCKVFVWRGKLIAPTYWGSYKALGIDDAIKDYFL